MRLVVSGLILFRHSRLCSLLKVIYKTLFLAIKKPHGDACRGSDRCRRSRSPTFCRSTRVIVNASEYHGKYVILLNVKVGDRGHTRFDNAKLLVTSRGSCFAGPLHSLDMSTNADGNQSHSQHSACVGLSPAKTPERRTSPHVKQRASTCCQLQQDARII